MSKNRHGLSRHIPSEIALKIRQQSRFGCVVCRCAIYQYEHIDPEFADATLHDPERICLLCGQCHDRVTRGRLSKQTVLDEYIRIRENQAVPRPYEELDLATANIKVVLGTASFEHARSLIQVNGENLLSIEPPRDGAAFPTITGVFYDDAGTELFRIDENIWQGPTDAWDLVVEGRSVSIKSGPQRVALSFEVEPPNLIRVTCLNMYKDNCHIVCDAEKLLVGQVHKDGYTYLGLGGFTCLGADPCISVDTRETNAPRLSGIRIIGGQGVLLDGTGVKIGVGAAGMWLQQLKVWTQTSS